MLPPDNLQFLPARVEAEIGTELELPLSLSVNIKGLIFYSPFLKLIFFTMLNLTWHFLIHE